MSVSVTALNLYPVKGLRGHPVTAAMVERCGFAGDRRWMVVDSEGRFLTQRDHPGMARITVQRQAGGLSLHAPGTEGIWVPVPDAGAEVLQVTVWRSTVRAACAANPATEWFGAVLGMPCRLVYLFDPDARQVDPAYAIAADRVSFADGFPVLLASDASLRNLNLRLPSPVPMQRFRPNLVVSGTTAWAEDHWRRIRIGEVIFRLPKPCSRCVVTTVDQQTGQRPDPREPLRTLATFRRTQDGVMFGQNMIPETLGQIAVGDAIDVLEDGPSNVIPIQK